MVTSPPVDANLPKELANLPCNGPLVYKVKKGLVGKNAEARKGWAALDESKRQKYVKKANKNAEKRRAILKEYKKTEKYKQCHNEFEQWKRSVEKHYPPRPKLKHAVPHWRKTCDKL